MIAGGLPGNYPFKVWYASDVTLSDLNQSFNLESARNVDKMDKLAGQRYF